MHKLYKMDNRYLQVILESLYITNNLANCYGNYLLQNPCYHNLLAHRARC